MSRSQFGVASVKVCGSYRNIVACLWTRGEQVVKKNGLLCCRNRRMVVIQGELLSAALIAFLCYLFMCALAHTHTHLNTTALAGEHTLILRLTLNTAHTHNAHLCVLLAPSPAVFANDALVVLSVNALQIM